MNSRVRKLACGQIAFGNREGALDPTCVSCLAGRGVLYNEFNILYPQVLIDDEFYRDLG